MGGCLPFCQCCSFTVPLHHVLDIRSKAGWPGGLWGLGARAQFSVCSQIGRHGRDGLSWEAAIASARRGTSYESEGGWLTDRCGSGAEPVCIHVLWSGVVLELEAGGVDSPCSNEYCCALALASCYEAAVCSVPLLRDCAMIRFMVCARPPPPPPPSSPPTSSRLLQRGPKIYCRGRTRGGALSSPFWLASFCGSSTLSTSRAYLVSAMSAARLDCGLPSPLPPCWQDLHGAPTFKPLRRDPPEPRHA